MDYVCVDLDMWQEVVCSRVDGDIDICLSSKEDHRPVLVEFVASVGISLPSKAKGDDEAAINLTNTRDPLLRQQFQDRLWHHVDVCVSDVDVGHRCIVNDIKRVALKVFGSPKKPWISSSTWTVTR